MKANGAVSSFCLCAAMAACACSAVADMTTNIVEKGETFVVSSDEDVAQLAGSQLILRGTLDLNGHDVSVTAMNTMDDVKIGGTSVASTGAKIMDSSGNQATFTVQGGSAYFTGRVDPSVDFVFNGGEMQLLALDQSFAPRKLTIMKTKVMAFSNPTHVYFVFRDVAADVAEEKKVRLGELMPTYQGVAVAATRDFLGTSYMDATWTDLQTTSYAYWSHGDIIPEGGVMVAFQVGNSGVTGAIGCAKIDGYRMATAPEPAYTPTSWDVYFRRADATGLVLVDSRRDDPLNRPQISTSLEKDVWSNKLSQNYTLDNVGSPFGAATEIELASGATLRISSMATCAVGEVTGAGTIQIDDGSTFAPKSLANWSGKFTTVYSTDFGREAKVQVPESGWHAAFDNKEIVVVGKDGELVCDGTTTPNPLNARLADGEGKLGLTVRAGEGMVQDLVKQSAAYSGETKVESGTLRVLGALDSVTCKYIRITPLKMTKKDGNGCYWGMNEFEVYDANGDKVSHKDSTVTTTAAWNGSYSGSKLFDEDITDKGRMLPKGYDADGNLPTVTIAMNSPVTFSTYRWYTSTYNGSIYEARFPLELVIEVSSDGNDWIVADSRAQAYPGAEGWIGGDTGFPLKGGVLPTEVPTLPEKFAGTSSKGAAFVECVKAQYIRFRPYETFLGGKFEGQYDYGWHVSEFSLVKDGKIVPWPEGTTRISKGMDMSAKSNGNDERHFADNVHTGEIGNVTGAHRCFYDQCGGYVELNVQNPIEFDGYILWNGPSTDNTRKRLPRAWTVDIGLEKGVWYNLDNHKACEDDVCVGAYEPYGPFSLKDRWPINGVGNAIGDRSKVSVAQGAALSLATGFERVGGLAGAGSVYLADSTLSLNACQPATFSGAVSGSGTLEVTGEGTQSFDGADLSAVKTLALNGGAIDGTASFGGNDLTVAFGGGATWAALSGIGALTVTGDVKLALPEDVLRDGGSVTLFSYDSVDAGSKTALEAATVVGGLRRGRTIEIVVGEKSTTATVYKNGFMFFIR